MAKAKPQEKEQMFTLRLTKAEAHLLCDNIAVVAALEVELFPIAMAAQVIVENTDMDTRMTFQTKAVKLLESIGPRGPLNSEQQKAVSRTMKEAAREGARHGNA